MTNAADPGEGGSATNPVHTGRVMSSVRNTIPLRMTRATEENTAAGIYGVIVASSVMAAAHAETAIAVDLAVLVTLVIYWGAEATREWWRSGSTTVTGRTGASCGAS
jgi:hypothetical protein